MNGLGNTTHSIITEVPYAYLLCIPEYSGVRYWGDNFTGCGDRVGYQSGMIYRNLCRFTDWREVWQTLHEKEFFDE